MERAVFFLVCLSAALCIASCQDICPDDFLSDRLKYIPGGYEPGSQALLVRSTCRYNLAARYPQYFTSSSRYVLTYIYNCPEGFSPLLLQDGPGGYICELDGATIEPEEPTDVSAGVTPDVPTAADDRPTPAIAIASDRQDPTEPATRPTTRPPATSAPGGVSECPSDGPYRRNNYVFSSLSLIEQKDCFVKTRIQGAASQHTTTVWVCKAGYVRKAARRNQFKCEKA